MLIGRDPKKFLTSSIFKACSDLALELKSVRILQLELVLLAIEPAFEDDEATVEL